MEKTSKINNCNFIINSRSTSSGLNLVFILLFILSILPDRSAGQESGNLIDEWAGVKVKDMYPSFYVNEWEQMHKSKKKAMDDFSDMKYGMFIHFGVYTTTGGIWEGKRMEDWKRSRHVEWLMLSARIPREKYETLFPLFNPVKFNAEEIVTLALNAGMKYLVVTSKHHDGFAMYETKYSPYNIMDATPFKRDIIRELHDACRKHGIAFGVYYSHNIDWLEGSDSQLAEVIEKNIDIGYPNKAVCANDWDPSPNTFTDYLEKKAYPQIRELLTKYPDIFCLWYDMPWRMKPSQSFNFYKIPYDINSKVLISERIGHGFGDYYIPGDNEIPHNTEKIQKSWETCGTNNNSWAFKSYDEDWKSPKEILYWLVDVVSKGGNYLLNIGPDPQGSVPGQATDNLLSVGRWLKTNGEAVYGTSRWNIVREGPREEFDIKGTVDRATRGFQDNFTVRDFWFTKKDNSVYAICLASPGKEILINSFNKESVKIKNVEVLGLGRVKYTQTSKGLNVVIPKNFKPESGFVVKVRI